MLIYINIIITVLLGILCFKIKKQVLHPGVLFNVWWFIISLLYLINPANLLVVSNEVYLIILVGTLSFNFPMLLSLIIKDNYKVENSNTIIDEVACKISIKKLNILQIIFLISMIPLLFKILPTLATQGLGFVRYMYSTNEGSFMTNTERVLYIYVLVFPCISATFLLSTILWGKGYMKLSQMWLGILCYIFQILISGGRMMIVDATLYFFLAYNSNKYKKGNKEVTGKVELKKSKRRRRQIIISFFCIFLMGVYITVGRSGAEVDPIKKFFSTIGIYFTLGPRLLQYAVNNTDAFGLNMYTYGGIFIAGLFELIRWLVLVLTRISLPSFFAIAQQYMGDYFYVGSNLNLNAFPTMYYYFMRDFGYLGIIIESITFGLLSLVLYQYLRKKNSLWGCILYSLVLITIFYSPIWWHPYRVEFWTPSLNLIWIIPLIKKRKIKTNRYNE